jgi:subtilisin family serine protease
MGHGTMVASVAGTPNGVAPGASIGSYRVFGCSGYATDDILIEAIDRAVRDGCDIINLSLATGSGYADWVSCCGVVVAAGLSGSVWVETNLPAQQFS